MPPLFVDGVEMNSIFVNGAEQDSVFADGVEVFSGLQGEDMFDDFERSANGTPVLNHLMNTGNAWIAGRSFGTPTTIETFQNRQNAFRQAPGTGSSFLSLRAVPLLEFAEAYHCSVDCNWGTLNPNSVSANLYTHQISPAVGNSTNIRIFYNGSAVQMWIQMNGTDFNNVSVPASGIDQFTLEVFFDAPLNLIAGRIRVGGVPSDTGTLSTLENPVDTFSEIFLSENRVIGQNAISAFSNYELTAFPSGSVPFP